MCKGLGKDIGVWGLCVGSLFGGYYGRSGVFREVDVVKGVMVVEWDGLWDCECDSEGERLGLDFVWSFC